METREKIVFEDRTKLKKVIFKYPELAAKEAEDKIKEQYNTVLALDEQLQFYREHVRELEAEYISQNKVLEEMSSLCTLEFETVETEYITSKSNTLIKGLGNDILGYYNK